MTSFTWIPFCPDEPLLYFIPNFSPSAHDFVETTKRPCGLFGFCDIGADSVEGGFQFVQFLDQFLGHAGDFVVVFPDGGGFLLPQRPVDGEQGLQVHIIKAAHVQVFFFRQVAQGGFHAAGLALEALDGPGQDADVLSEAGPEEALVLVP